MAYKRREYSRLSRPVSLRNLCLKALLNQFADPGTLLVVKPVKPENHRIA